MRIVDKSFFLNITNDGIDCKICSKHFEWAGLAHLYLVHGGITTDMTHYAAYNQRVIR